MQTYEVLRVKKQATIKAYYKQDSLLFKYFGRFLFVKVMSAVFACVGSVALFFMLLFPSGSDIFIFCVLVPCSIYAFKVAKIICKANISLEFASILAKKYTAFFCAFSDIFIFCVLVPCSIYAFKVAKIICKANISLEFASILAKKYTAFFCAFCACVGEFVLNGFMPHEVKIAKLHEHYQYLLESYHISQMSCQWWQELFGFILLKKAVVDMLYFSNHSLHTILSVLFAFGYFSSFVSFSLLVLSGYSTKQNVESHTDLSKDSNPKAFHTSKAFRQFFAVVFFLIFLYLALYLSSLLQPLAKVSKPMPEILATQFLAQNQQYIEVSIQGVQSFVDTKDVVHLQSKIKSTLKNFETNLNDATQASLEDYLAKKEVIIDEYAKWYFSVYGEYTRLFYAAIGKGEDIAQEQFVFLLKAYTPNDVIIDEYAKWYFSVYGEYTRLFYAAIGKGEDIAQEQFVFLLKAYTPNDLQERLNRVYDEQFENLKKRLEQDFSFFTISKKPSQAFITHSLSFDDFTRNLNVLNPRATDGVAALLGASVVGAMILKSSSKAFGKAGAKLVGKSVAKKGVSGAVGAGGSLVCGPFAPLCAIGFFVATDVVINSVDEALNQEEFKNQMRKGFDMWEIQLKNSLVGYNSQLSKQIYENLGLDSQPYQQKEQ